MPKKSMPMAAKVCEPHSFPIMQERERRNKVLLRGGGWKESGKFCCCCCYKKGSKNIISFSRRPNNLENNLAADSVRCEEIMARYTLYYIGMHIDA
jgi:hypothetical protein